MKKDFEYCGMEIIRILFVKEELILADYGYIELIRGTVTYTNLKTYT
jgi:hypothetical protein